MQSLSTVLAIMLGAATLKVGDKAPDFTLPDADGKAVSLSALLAKGPVILAFFPKAFTPGWTREVQAYRDRHAEIAGKGARVVAISTDDVTTLKRFRDQYGLPYPLLSDAGGAVARQYAGVVPIVGVANRATFVLGADGRVLEIVTGGDAIDPTRAISACPGGRG